VSDFVSRNVEGIQGNILIGLNLFKTCFAVLFSYCIMTKHHISFFSVLPTNYIFYAKIIIEIISSPCISRHLLITLHGSEADMHRAFTISVSLRLILLLVITGCSGGGGNSYSPPAASVELDWILTSTYTDGSTSP
jgi:hypothetical protein